MRHGVVVVKDNCPDYNSGMAKKKRRGAPRKENPATVRVEFRATPDQRDSWAAAAKRAGVTLSAWLKALADKAAGR
jgi:hypothetical protein